MEVKIDDDSRTAWAKRRQSAGPRSRASTHLVVCSPAAPPLAVVPLSFVVQWPTRLPVRRQSRRPLWRSGDAVVAAWNAGLARGRQQFFFFFLSSEPPETLLLAALSHSSRARGPTQRRTVLCVQRDYRQENKYYPRRRLVVLLYRVNTERMNDVLKCLKTA